MAGMIVMFWKPLTMADSQPFLTTWPTSEVLQSCLCPGDTQALQENLSKCKFLHMHILELIWSLGTSLADEWPGLGLWGNLFKAWPERKLTVDHVVWWTFAFTLQNFESGILRLASSGSWMPVQYERDLSAWTFHTLWFKTCSWQSPCLETYH